MNKDIEYEPFSIVSIQWKENGSVTIKSGKQDVQFKHVAHSARIIGSWIIECKDKSIYLRENETQLQEDDCILLNFSNETSITLNHETIQTQHVRIYPHAVHKIRAIVSNQELEDERKKSQQLEEILSQRLDENLSQLQSQKGQLSSQLETKMNEMERIQKENAELQTRITTASNELETEKQQLAVLKSQIEDIHSLQEVSHLDVETAKKELEELKVQAEFDQSSFDVLKEQGSKNNESLQNLFEQIRKDLKKAEHRIQMIVKWRTGYNNIVEKAILQTDGTILLSDEKEEEEEDEQGKSTTQSNSNITQ